jgi:DNA mismatch repair protein MutS
MKQIISEFERTNKKAKESIYHEYYKAYVDAVEKYGDKTCVLYMVGKFYEAYGFEHNGVTYGNYKQIAQDTGYKIAKEGKTSPTYTDPHFVGFPLGGYDKHLALLIKLGYTIVFYDQTPHPTQPKKFIRELTRVVSPGTHIENLDLYSSHKERNNILSIFFDGITNKSTAKECLFHCGVAVVDVSTGDLDVGEIYSAPNDRKKIQDELYRILETYSPSEIIITYRNLSDGNTISELLGIVKGYNSWFEYNVKKWRCEPINTRYFKNEYQEDVLYRTYPKRGTITIFEDLGINAYDMGIVSLIRLFDFIYDYSKTNISNIKRPTVLYDDKYLVIENNAVTQLGISDKLFPILNETQTPMGYRLLRERLLNPLRGETEMNKRYNLVEDFIQMKNSDDETYSTIKLYLNKIGDITRLQRKIDLGLLTPKELSRLDTFYYYVVKLIVLLGKSSASFLKEILPDMHIRKQIKKYKAEYRNKVDLELAAQSNIEDVGKKITEAEEDFFTFIKPHISEKIDELQLEIRQINLYFTNLLEEINNVVRTYYSGNAKDPVKLCSTPKEGFYISITTTVYPYVKKHVSSLDFTKRKGGYKCVTSAMKTYSSKLKDITDQLRTETTRVYKDILSELTHKYNDAMNFMSEFIGVIDVAFSSSITSIKYGYSRPVIDSKEYSSVDAHSLRNPIGERLIRELYVANDIKIESDGILLYAVNASGKSYLMKALALNIIMAQAGLYVSATHFVLSPYYNLFTRVGNIDSDLHSSFQMEMLDVKSILQRSNQNTFVVLDELTCSTENMSALAISYSMIKRLVKNKSSFIFATHLIDLYDILKEKPLDAIHIYHLDTESNGNEVIYHRKLKPGMPDKYYGIEVAKSILYGDDEFIEDAFSIRNHLLDQRATFSSYNSQMIVKKCDICGSNKNLEVHHINFQKDADKNGIIKNQFHKNVRGNLCCLCDKCHHLLHQGKIDIIGWTLSTDKNLYFNYRIK